MKPSLLLIDGSLGGESGNTARACQHWLRLLAPRAEMKTIHLREGIPSLQDLASQFEASDGFLFATGTYWDTWGSPMQRFFEEITPLEGHPCWLGKPAAILVTQHSVGGKAVLSRLQGVLSTFGLLIPPMSGMVFSLAGLLASQSESEFKDDFWTLDDLKTMTHNLLEAVHLSEGRTPNWKAWSVDLEDPKRLWLA